MYTEAQVKGSDSLSCIDTLEITQVKMIYKLMFYIYYCINTEAFHSFL